LADTIFPGAVSCQHHLPGRMRIRIDSMKKNSFLADYLTAASKNSPFIKEVHFSPHTGRALLRYNPALHKQEDIINTLSEIICGIPPAAAGGQSGRPPSGKVKEPEDLPLKRQYLNVGLCGLALALFSYRKVTGRTSYLAESPGLFTIAAITTLIAGYPMFKSGLVSLTKKNRVNHDALLSAISLTLILLRESIPGLTVVGLAGVISLLEALVLKATAALSRDIARRNSNQFAGGTEFPEENSSLPSPDNNCLENHYITGAARTYGERMSNTAFWLAALSGLQGKDLGKSLSVLLASSPGAAGQALPSSLAASAALASKHGIMVRNRRALAKAAQIKTVVFTGSSLLAPDFSLGSVLTVTNLSPSDCLAAAEALAGRSGYYAGLFKERGHAIRGVVLSEDTAAGVRGMVNSTETILGSQEFVEQCGISTQPAEYKIRRLNRFCQTPVFLALDGRLVAVIGINRPVPDKSRESLLSLKALGVDTVLVTAEKMETVMPLKAQTGIEVLAETPYTEVPYILQEISRRRGALAVVGVSPEDGSALSEADLSFVFSEADLSLLQLGDIFLNTKDISKINETLIISRRCNERATQNLLLVMAFNLFGLAAASTGRLSPAGAAVYNNLAGIAVAVNSLRLIAASKLPPTDYPRNSGPGRL